MIELILCVYFNRLNFEIKKIVHIVVDGIICKLWFFNYTCESVAFKNQMVFVNKVQIIIIT